MQPEQPNEAVHTPLLPADLSHYARLLGRRGGAIKSEKKTLAARKNGALGGRPKKPQAEPINE
jgi:hypothetical protein